MTCGRVDGRDRWDLKIEQAWWMCVAEKQTQQARQAENQLAGGLCTMPPAAT